MTMDTPNLGGNVFFLACHASLIAPQLYYGIRHRTWGYLFGMFCGHVLEIVGFASHIRMHFGQDGFLTYIVTITIGPAFFTAAVYLCLARVIAVYGQHYSRFSPRTYTITFMLFDFVALVLQAAGGSMLGSDMQDTINVGLKVMKAGLAAHLAAISIFVILASELAFRIARGKDKWNPKFSQLQGSWKFNMFLACLTIATVTILIRTAYRVAELSAGYHSKLAENETAFMFLEGTMVVIATASLAISHPGICFQGRWREADFQLKKSGSVYGAAKSDQCSLEMA
ncbi:RTA1 like protein-domain-containing protein [Dactylonectria macrodidyma]|uniref:RTA1 like protein-domain-containing protein n=1 Tax=Dactylonectria macrodidyma TaxID=307937 RepID=A0A9P9F957_9HYPO|nr:RTA1 like protein-domain-containing protein [Dactylonectria macrodidyma]